MLKFTDKIRICGAFAVLFMTSSAILSCGSSQKMQATEATSVVDSTEQALDSLTVPDSLPAMDDSAKVRPEPRKTR